MDEMLDVLSTRELEKVCGRAGSFCLSDVWCAALWHTPVPGHFQSLTCKRWEVSLLPMTEWALLVGRELWGQYYEDILLAATSVCSHRGEQEAWSNLCIWYRIKTNNDFCLDQGTFMSTSSTSIRGGLWRMKMLIKQTERLGSHRINSQR